MKDIKTIIDTLQDGHFYGAGEFVEIAKGSKEIVTDFKSIKTKIRRKWLSKRT
tara:strand:- start:1607 stop:1765 length:159 start_codon:yes stop_codon:yes gene_type:complete